MLENLAAAERLRDRGLLATLCTSRHCSSIGDMGRGAGAQRPRTGAGGRPSAAPPVTRCSEYQTGNDIAGGHYVQRLINADREAQPYPLAGVFTAITLSQIAYITNGITPMLRCARLAP